MESVRKVLMLPVGAALAAKFSPSIEIAAKAAPTGEYLNFRESQGVFPHSETSGTNMSRLQSIG